MKFVPLLNALSITGHDTVSGLDQWIRRYNRANPGTPVLRISGKVDTETLRAALRHYATSRATSAAQAKAIHSAEMKGRARCNGRAQERQ